MTRVHTFVLKDVAFAGASRAKIIRKWHVYVCVCTKTAVKKIKEGKQCLRTVDGNNVAEQADWDFLFWYEESELRLCRSTTHSSEYLTRAPEIYI